MPKNTTRNPPRTSNPRYPREFTQAFGPGPTRAHMDRAAGFAQLLAELERTQQQPTGKKARRRWATRNAQAANRSSFGGNVQQKGRTSASGARNANEDPIKRHGWWESQRRQLIVDRNRARRLPWVAAAGTLATGCLGSLVTSLYGLTNIPALPTAAGVAVVPVLAATHVAVRVVRPPRYATKNVLDEHLGVDRRTFLPDIGAAAVVSSALVFWISLAAVGPLVLIVLIISTVILGSRWWSAYPVGPGEDALEPARPEPVPAPAPEAEPATKPEIDHIAIAWRKNLGKTGGKLEGSWLTNRTVAEFITTYDLELNPGKHTWHDAQHMIKSIASGLGLSATQVMVGPPDSLPSGEAGPENRGRLTVITTSPVTSTRYYTGPKVVMSADGRSAVLTGVARYRDGMGEASVKLWNRDGTQPTAIIGGTGGGKSATANQITVGALSTRLLNMIYVDFKGNSSQALRSRARIAVIGHDAALRSGELFDVIMRARLGDNPPDTLFPTKDKPGWFFLIDEITKGLKKAGPFAEFVERAVTTVRSLGVLMLGTTQNQQQSAWLNAIIRDAFTRQSICFYNNSKDGGELIEGLGFNTKDLPRYGPNAGEDLAGQPIPGWAVHGGSGRNHVPAWWDFLPSDDAELDEEPPYRVSSALDQFADQPDIHPDEYQALVDFLGPPNAPGGRWVIGLGGMPFPEPDLTVAAVSGTSTARVTRFGGAPIATPANQDSDTVRRVLGLIEAGITKTQDLYNAMADKASASTVKRALAELVGDNRIHRLHNGRGSYALGPAPTNTGQPAELDEEVTQEDAIATEGDD